MEQAPDVPEDTVLLVDNLFAESDAIIHRIFSRMVEAVESE